MAPQRDAFKLDQSHGKSSVRVARVWKNADGSAHDFVEWNVAVRLLSDCIQAYTLADNSPIVATDTIKNTVIIKIRLFLLLFSFLIPSSPWKWAFFIQVYVKAKSCSHVVSMEEFGIILGTHFTKIYPQVVSLLPFLSFISWSDQINFSVSQFLLFLGYITSAVISIVEKPWDRVVVDGQSHHHGLCLFIFCLWNYGCIYFYHSFLASHMFPIINVFKD